MMYENPLYDKNFRLVISDVVYRFYIFGQYNKNPKNAVKALKKRAPGYSDEIYSKLFEASLKLLVTIIGEKEDKSNFETKELRKIVDRFYLR